MGDSFFYDMSNWNTIILEIFALLIFVHLFFVVIYYLQFQAVANIRYSKIRSN